MSVINKIPLINQILSGLSSSQLSDLKDCINGEGPEPIFRSLKPISGAHLTSADYGVKPIKLELAIPLGGMSIYEGYLIYTVSMCYVICYSGEENQCLTILKIDVAKNSVQIMNNSLTILGLRSELDDSLDEDENSEAQVVGTPKTYGPATLTHDGPYDAHFHFSAPNMSDKPGVFILMFNTTAVVIPYYPGIGYSRFVCNAIYNDAGDGMIVRGKLYVSGAVQGKMIFVEFEESFATALNFTTMPYGSIMFIPFNV